jgi:hypothetical protein
MKRNEKGVKDLGTLVVSSQSRVPCLSVVFLVHDCRCVPVSVPQSSFSRESSAEYEDIRVQVCQFSGVDSVARARRSSPIFRITRPRSRSIFGQSPANILHGSSPSLARKNPGRGRVSPLVLAHTLTGARAHARPSIRPTARQLTHSRTHTYTYSGRARGARPSLSLRGRVSACVCLRVCRERSEIESKRQHGPRGAHRNCHTVWPSSACGKFATSLLVRDEPAGCIESRTLSLDREARVSGAHWPTGESSLSLGSPSHARPVS